MSTPARRLMGGAGINRNKGDDGWSRLLTGSPFTPGSRLGHGRLAAGGDDREGRDRMRDQQRLAGTSGEQIVPRLSGQVKDGADLIEG